MSGTDFNALFVPMHDRGGIVEFDQGSGELDEADKALVVAGVVDDDRRPSGSETFQQLAQVLVTGDIEKYVPGRPSNTHWSNWPDGGTL